MKKTVKYFLAFFTILMLAFNLMSHDAEAAKFHTDGNEDKFNFTKKFTDFVTPSNEKNAKIDTGNKELDDKVDDLRAKEDKNYGKARQKNNLAKAQRKSYAAIVFDNEKANDTIYYFNKQTKTKVPTVESKIYNQTKNKNTAKEYATFLNSLHNWNLYSVNTTISDQGLSFFGSIFKVGYGVCILICYVILKILDSLYGLFADILNQINLFKYLDNGTASLTKDSPLYSIKFLIDGYNKIGLLGKILLAVFLGYIAFRVATGFGKASNRGSFFKSHITRAIMAIIAAVTAATIASMSISITSDVLEDTKGTGTSTIEDIPKKYIIDNSRYIDNSLSKIDGKKGAEGTNNGYVLNHNHLFPKNPTELKNNVPSPELVEYMNTGNDKKNAEKIDGISLFKSWVFSTTVNANDITTLYQLNKDKDKQSFKSLMFKMAPLEMGVKLKGGKEFFGSELKDAEIHTANLAGNSGVGVFLNAIKLGVLVVLITFISVTLFWSIVVGAAVAIKDFVKNVTLSPLLFVQCFFGVLITAALLPLGAYIAKVILKFFPDVVLAIDKSSTAYINNNVSMDGIAKQLIQTIALIVLAVVLTTVTLAVRKGIMEAVGNGISKVLEVMNPSVGTANSADKQALKNALDGNLAGHDTATGISKDPFGAAKDGMGNVKDFFKKDKKDEEDENALLDSQNEEENNKEFEGEASTGVEEGSDVEGDDIQQDIDEGLEKLNDTTDEGAMNNIEEQEQNLENAEDEFNKLEGKQNELDNAESELAQLKETNAPQEEIDAAEDKVANAGRALDEQLGNSQAANKKLTQSGIGLDELENNREQAMKDYHNANDEIESAEKELYGLNQEKEEMEAYGASAEQIQEKEDEINQVKNGLKLSETKRDLAQKAYQADVKNPETEQLLRNDIISAQEEKVNAEQNLDSAAKTGNLSSEEYDKLQNAAFTLDEDVNNIGEGIHQKINQGIATNHAIKHLRNNDYNAFSDKDISTQQSQLDNVKTNITKLEERYKDISTDASAPQEHIVDVQESLNREKENYENMLKTTQAISTGRNLSDAIRGQQAVMSNAHERKQNLQQTLKVYEERDLQGVPTDRDTRKDIEVKYKEASTAFENSERIMSGLQTVHSLGKNKATEEELGSIESNNNVSLENLYKEKENVQGVQSTIGKLKNGENVNMRETGHLYQTQKTARRSAADKANEANNRLKAAKEKIQKLKNDEKKGVHVKQQLEKWRKKMEDSKRDLENAKNKETSISSEGFNINSIGITMKQNLSDAIKNVENVNTKVTKLKSEHENMLKTGGVSKDQLNNYRKEVEKKKEGIKLDDSLNKQEDYK
ncbi:hypothetical protein ACF0HT_14135 (plasmid) [Staphylococcus xylosus]|uniref:hypothetical protein n=1 Tax=Staphylococcus xylosus TaxID=1288 RepID=UPI00374A42AA